MPVFEILVRWLPSTKQSKAGSVKCAVLGDGSLMIQPKFVNGQAISHTALSGGAPVRAAGEALEIGSHRGHFMPSQSSLDVGMGAFRNVGVGF